MRTYYDVLGVSDDASTAAIRAAYRERLKEIHPDVSDAADASEATQLLVEARDVLVDEDERARYDRLGHEAYVARNGTGRAGNDADGAPTATTGGVRNRSAGETGSGEARTRTTGSGSADGSGNGAADVSWRTQRSASVYTVRQPVQPNHAVRLEVPSGRSLTLFVLSFALYPVLLASTLLPAFPLSVNALVGLCTLLLIAYLQSEPTIAVMVFGGWSVLTTLLVVALPISVFSLVGVLALFGTWFPLGFSILTLSVLRM